MMFSYLQVARSPPIGQLLGGARNDQLQERGRLGARVRRLLDDERLERGLRHRVAS